MPNTIFEDILAFAKTIDVTGETDPTSKTVLRELQARCDCPYKPGDALEGIVEVQKATPGDRTGGTMDFQFGRFVAGDPNTYPLLVTANVPWDATAEEIQTQVDIKAPESWGNYVAGDIAITGGPAGVGGADIFVTFSGASVHGFHNNHAYGQTGLTGGTSDLVISEVTAGRHARFWFAALKRLGVISGTDPVDLSDTPAGQYTIANRDELENWPSNATIKALVREATVQEWEDWETEILTPLNISF